MAISIEEVKYIANLSRIELSENEISHFQAQLEGILEYVDKLKKLDVSGVLPMYHVLDIKNVFRPDSAAPSLVASKVLKSAPASEGNFYKVPKVIE